jgi:hypothetical protein
MSPTTDAPTIAPDHEVERDREPSGPLCSVPALRLVAPRGRPLVLHLLTRMEHVRHGRSLPGLPSSMGWEAKRIEEDCLLSTRFRLPVRLLPLNDVVAVASGFRELRFV